MKPCEVSHKVAFGEEVSRETLGFPEVCSRCGAVLILAHWAGKRLCVAGAAFRCMDTAVFVAGAA